MDDSALRLLSDVSDDKSAGTDEVLSQWHDLTDEDLFVLTREGEHLLLLSLRTADLQVCVPTNKT